MNVLVTGAVGFVGRYLVEEIASTQPAWAIHGTRRPKEATDKTIVKKTGLHLHTVDINNEKAVSRLLKTIQPEIIFHLAAQSYVRTSWESPQATIATNIIGQVNVLEAIRLLKTKTYNPTIIIVGSSEEYGAVSAKQLPITEAAPLQPLSPYAISKIGQDLLGFQYFKTYGLRTIRLRVFNHTGPRRPVAFGDSYVAHQIAAIEAGLAKPILTYRDLTAVRDYSDVRDIVKAYILAAQHCRPGEVYNVCSGHGTSIKQMYDTLLGLATVKPIALKPDPAGPRPTDGGRSIGDNRKFVTTTGWQPQYDFLKHTLPDILNYWRQQITI